LENPFRALRRLYSMTEKILLIETMCLPGDRPTMELLDESQAENQGLRFVAFIHRNYAWSKCAFAAAFLSCPPSTGTHH
jgi:hypothetical protein